jgi:hypothetical protein
MQRLVPVARACSFDRMAKLMLIIALINAALLARDDGLAKAAIPFSFW